MLNKLHVQSFLNVTGVTNLQSQDKLISQFQQTMALYDVKKIIYHNNKYEFYDHKFFRGNVKVGTVYALDALSTHTVMYDVVKEQVSLIDKNTYTESKKIKSISTVNSSQLNPSRPYVSNIDHNNSTTLTSNDNSFFWYYMLSDHNNGSLYSERQTADVTTDVEAPVYPSPSFGSDDYETQKSSSFTSSSSGSSSNNNNNNNNNNG